MRSALWHLHGVLIQHAKSRMERVAVLFLFAQVHHSYTYVIGLAMQRLAAFDIGTILASAYRSEDGLPVHIGSVSLNQSFMEIVMPR